MGNSTESTYAYYGQLEGVQGMQPTVNGNSIMERQK